MTRKVPKAAGGDRKSKVATRRNLKSGRVDNLLIDMTRRGRQRPTKLELAPWPERWLYDMGFRDDREPEPPPDEEEAG